jgi:hypothetical protein
VHIPRRGAFRKWLNAQRADATEVLLRCLQTLSDHDLDQEHLAEVTDIAMSNSLPFRPLPSGQQSIVAKGPNWTRKCLLNRRYTLKGCTDSNDIIFSIHLLGSPGNIRDAKVFYDHETMPETVELYEEWADEYLSDVL